jgi:four helix bundle protein
LSIYRVTASFPADERFGLTNQLRRASVSIACNIAEGYGRGSTQDYLRFLRVARGSVYEVETQLSFAAALGYLRDHDRDPLRQQIDDCAKVLNGLITSVGRSEKST